MEITGGGSESVYVLEFLGVLQRFRFDTKVLSGQGIGDRCEMVENMEIYDLLGRSGADLHVSGG